MRYNPDFLKRLDENKVKTLYARIIALQLNETPIETIEGRVTQGSINIDGSSAVRRTCALTIVANKFDYSNYLWGLNTKFKLEIGVENTIDSSYPDIIWFKQGTYFISSFNMSKSTNNFTISIQGKDKMCALNGELGGTLHSSVDFGTMEEVNADNVTNIIKLPLKTIIKNIVHIFGGEQEHNIVINDLDNMGLELLEYRYDIPMYLYREIDSKFYENVTLDGGKECIYDKEITTLNELPNEAFEQLVNSLVGSKEDLKTVTIQEKDYYVAKISYGETAGYRITDLTYAGDLIGAVGDSLTSILDKIKNMLGNFEYFYNLDGQFVFQKKKTYVESSWSPIAINDNNQTYILDDNEISYAFNNGELINQFNNNPNLSNLKNDFSVWGERESLSGAKVAVHMRYVIDQKPDCYTSISISDEDGSLDKDLLNEYNNKYNTNIKGQTSITYVSSNRYSIDENKVYCDWREIIYQMAKDYSKYAHIFDDFSQRVIEKNPWFFNGVTGYENYYTDLISYWRDLYNPTLKSDDKKTLEENIDSYQSKINKLKEQKETLSQAIKILNQEIEIDNYSSNEDRDNAINRLKTEEENLLKCQNEISDNEKLLLSTQTQLLTYDNYYIDTIDGNKQYWNKTVFEYPENLNFWFDFLDSEGELSQYSVKNVGNRPKAINDTNIKAIYFRETPEVIFSTNVQTDLQYSGARVCINASVAHADTMFSISSQGKSAKNMIDELLYKHSYCIETATINTIPIYYLQPNTKIKIYDEETHLDSYYCIDKMTIPLSYSGMMSIQATKASSNMI